MNKILKNALILMAITLVAGLDLGFTYDITKGPIAEQEQKAKEEAYQAVFADASSYEALELDAEAVQTLLAEAGYGAQEIDEAMLAKDEADAVLGVVMTVTSGEGYGGDIQFAMGIQNDGTVNGIQILSIEETAGLGMKATEETFYGQFSAKKVDAFRYTKTGAASDNEIDALSGATVTTNAMVNGVNAGIVYFNSLVEGGVVSE